MLLCGECYEKVYIQNLHRSRCQRICFKLSTRGFWREATWLSSPSHLTSLCFPDWSRHFDTTVVIEAEWQAVLNTLTEHDFQAAFNNGRSTGKGTYAQKGTTSRVIVASRPKINSWPDDSSFPETADYFRICVACNRVDLKLHPTLGTEMNVRVQKPGHISTA
jgi:hypothetical protein